MTHTNVAIVGGGFGGLTVAKELRKSELSLLVIDKTNHHLFQPLLYQVATAALSAADIAVPIRQVLAKQRNTSVIMGNVIDIDKEKKQLHLEDGAIITFDYLVLAVGSHHSYFGHPSWEKYAPGVKTLEDAYRIRDKVLIAFERAERCDTAEESQKHLRFAIVGGGPTGVELAGALGEIAHLSMRKNFRKIKPEDTKIFLIEGTDHILNAYPSRLSLKAKKDLERLGVQVITNKVITNITEQGVYFNEEFLPVENIIWAAGNKAPALLRTLGVPLDKPGRVKVEPDLSIPDYPNIFVIGDAAYLVDKRGKALAGIAPVAIQEGKYVAKIIAEDGKKDDRKKSKRKPFRYFDKGYMATIGKAKAIAVIGKWQLSGFIAWMAWSLIHILYLITFRTRIMVMMQWFFWYVTGLRSVRLITHASEGLKK